LISVGIGGLVLGLVAWFGSRQLHDIALPPPPPTAQTITVMKFENQRADGNDWYAGMLQAAFNTEVSRIPDLSVIAPEIIQREAQRAGVGTVETAQRLGVERFVIGSFAVHQGTIRIDARIVTTDKGVQEAAEQVEGRLDDFFALQNQLAKVLILDHFQLKLTLKQQQDFRAASAGRANLDKYQKFLRAEGVAGAAEPPSPGESERRSQAPSLPSLAQSVGRASGSILWPRAAGAQTQDDVAVRDLLEAYRRAQEGGDIDGLARLHVSFPDSQRSAIAEYFDSIEDLRVALSDIKIQHRSDDVAVSYIRKDDFVDKESGEPITVEVRVTKFVVRDNGQLKFADAAP
jgi:TolB-like protein